MRGRVRLALLKARTRWNGTTLLVEDDVRIDAAIVVNGGGRVRLGRGTTIGFPLATADPRPVMLQARGRQAVIEIGRDCVIVNGTEMIAIERISIGDECLIGPRCVLVDSDFHGIEPERRREKGSSRPVVLGRRCWLGLEALVLKGVTIGDGAVVGARVVLRHSVAARTITTSGQTDSVPIETREREGKDPATSDDGRESDA